jgi:hypothetical protein
MRCPFATWKGPIPNKSVGGMSRPLQGLVLHVIVGTLEAADSIFKNPSRDASAHFGVGKDGRLWQWVDTNDKAWAQMAGNPHWISVETEGQPTEKLTEAQMDTLAKLYGWLEETENIPLQIANDVNARGFGIHSMGGAAWGRHACPGVLRADQRQEILDRVHPKPAPEEDPVDIAQDFVLHPSSAGHGIQVDYLGGLHIFHPKTEPAMPGPKPPPPYWKDGQTPVRRIRVITWPTLTNGVWSGSLTGYIMDYKGGIHPFGGAPDVIDAGYW